MLFSFGFDQSRVHHYKIVLSIWPQGDIVVLFPRLIHQECSEHSAYYARIEHRYSHPMFPMLTLPHPRTSWQSHRRAVLLTEHCKSPQPCVHVSMVPFALIRDGTPDLEEAYKFKSFLGFQSITTETFYNALASFFKVYKCDGSICKVSWATLATQVVASSSLNEKLYIEQNVTLSTITNRWVARIRTENATPSSFP